MSKSDNTFFGKEPRTMLCFVLVIWKLIMHRMYWNWAHGREEIGLFLRMLDELHFIFSEIEFISLTRFSERGSCEFQIHMEQRSRKL